MHHTTTGRSHYNLSRIYQLAHDYKHAIKTLQVAIGILSSISLCSFDVSDEDADTDDDNVSIVDMELNLGNLFMAIDDHIVILPPSLSYVYICIYLVIYIYIYILLNTPIYIYVYI